MHKEPVGYKERQQADNDGDVEQYVGVSDGEGPRHLVGLPSQLGDGKANRKQHPHYTQEHGWEGEKSIITPRCA